MVMQSVPNSIGETEFNSGAVYYITADFTSDLLKDTNGNYLELVIGGYVQVFAERTYLSMEFNPGTPQNPGINVTASFVVSPSLTTLPGLGQAAVASPLAGGSRLSVRCGTGTQPVPGYTYALYFLATTNAVPANTYKGVIGQVICRN